MYLPAQFAETRPDVLHALIRDHPFGMLVTQGPAGLEANGLPFLIDADRGPHGTLRAHVARANPLWREARADEDSLVVFQGPQAYISPAWYPTKAETGQVVPTWNYAIVQGRGRLRAVEDATWVRQLVSDLTDHHEADRPKPWAVDDAPAGYIDKLLNAIVGIEIELTSLTGKWKVSQNRSAADRNGVVRGLTIENEGRDAAMATLVRDHGKG